MKGKKKKVCNNELCDNKSTEQSSAENSHNKLPIFHNKDELKNRSLKSGFIMSNNNYVDEDIKDEDLGNNYYDDEKYNNHPQSKTFDNIKSQKDLREGGIFG